MKEKFVNEAYNIAKERYAAYGIDTDKVLDQMQNFHLSMHCWQADDVAGFESAGDLTGGIQATGNYPGKARNIDELQKDILKAKSLIPGTHRLNLHEIYGDFKGKWVDRDEVEPKHFQAWIDWGKANDTKLDFNSTSFSHPKSGNLTLANPDKGIRDFWIEHTKRCRAIAEEMGKAQGDPCIMNLWVHDGCKDVSVNHYTYRKLLKDANVGESHHDSILRVTDFSNIKLNEDGTLADADKLKNAIKKDWSGFIATPSTKGAGAATPPGGSDAKPSGRAAQLAAQYHDNLYGKVKEN